MPTDTEMDMSEFMMPTKEKDMSESMMPTDKEIDESGSVLCGRKLPLWLGLLLLLAAGGLLVHLIYFAVRANSKACVDGLQAQKECQELNHLQRQLNQPQEVLQEKEAEAATCKPTVVSHCSPSREPRTWRSLPGSCGDQDRPGNCVLFITTKVWELANSLWHPTPVVLPGKPHGRRSLVGCSPWGR